VAYVSGLAGTRILLGVSGGIAAYKAAELVRRLRDAGAEVQVVMTAAATEFVTPLTFQALSGRPVRTSLWDSAAEAAMGHIELARWADRILIAPASADLIARLAAGMGDDLLTTLCLASAAPLFVAPAMNQQMWAHPATQANIATLRQRGATLLGPAAGDQACGETGPGRLLEAHDIVAALIASATPGALAGRRVLVNAGPTYEDIDPVRYLGNRSSGRMGFALAAAAAAAGAEVRLIAGPVHLDTPNAVVRSDVRSAQAMRDAVLANLDWCEVFIAAAAVADYMPATVATAKIKKSSAARTLELVPTADILAEVGQRPRRPFLVGFAAETESLERYALDKLQRKHLDLVIANQIGRSDIGIDAEDNELLVLWPQGRQLFPRAPKTELARALVLLIAERLRESESSR
jgi:phosphopantothenoylcysteine decarboxylase/phosphopantothenate--cysteine ligase